MSKKTRNQLLADALLNNVQFQGHMGTIYTIQDLLNPDTVSKKSLESLYSLYQNKLEKVGKASLFSKKSTQRDDINLRLELLEEVAAIRKEKAVAKRKETIARNEKAEKLAILRKIKNEKEIEALKSQSLEDLEKQLSELEPDEDDFV